MPTSVWERADQVRSENRNEVYLRIRELNPSASMEFLSRFSMSQLGSYLEHLLFLGTPRGKQSVWVRRAETPGIVSAEAA